MNVKLNLYFIFPIDHIYISSLREIHIFLFSFFGRWLSIIATSERLAFMRNQIFLTTKISDNNKLNKFCVWFIIQFSFSKVSNLLFQSICSNNDDNVIYYFAYESTKQMIIFTSIVFRSYLNINHNNKISNNIFL